MKNNKNILIELSAELYPFLKRLSLLAKDFDEKQNQTLISDIVVFLALIRNNKDFSIYDGCALGLIVRSLHFKTAENITEMAQESLNKLNNFRKESIHNSLQDFYNSYQMRFSTYMDENEIKEFKSIIYGVSELILKVNDTGEEEIKIAHIRVNETFKHQERNTVDTEFRKNIASSQLSAGGLKRFTLEEFANEIFPVVKRVQELAINLDEDQRKKLSNSFQNIIDLITFNRDLSVFDGYASGIVALTIDSSDNFEELIEKFNSPQIKQEMSAEMVDAITNDRNENGNTPPNELDSLEFLDKNQINEFKNIIREFAEITLRADGVSEEDSHLRIKNIIELPKHQDGSNIASMKKEDLKPKQEQAVINKTGKENEILKPTLDSVMTELNSLVGMENVKNDIQSLINVIKSNKQRKEAGLPQHKISLHSVFLGPPGTGKTSIARVLARIYHALGVIPGANFKETDRSDLVAGYTGQTAIKTDAVIKEALNGVLFIDEAYSLQRGTSEDSFGQEAIDTLLKRMEDFRENLIVIVAGYENEMSNFINSNPGLKSRFNKYFHFKDYDPAELTEIFKRMVEKDEYRLTQDSFNRINELFSILYSKKDDRFANARLARNIYDKTFENQANRTASINQVTKEILTTIEVDDIPFTEFIDNGN